MITLVCIGAILTTKAQIQPARTAPPLAYGVPGQPATSQVNLRKFDLDFPGGHPAQLVEMINQPLEGTLNVIIPREADGVDIPALKLKDVNVAQVFDALSHVSQKQIAYETVVMNQQSYVPQGLAFHPTAGTQFYNQYYGFRTDGPITENSVWYFYIEQPPAGQKIQKSCKYYQLGSYLTQYQIEDITTAIKTGWDMLGIKGDAMPQLKFHQDTKLLVAVGDSAKLLLIDDVLNELRKAPVSAPGEKAEPAQKKESTKPKENSKQ
jgi:hypothetical protein